MCVVIIFQQLILKTCLMHELSEEVLMLSKTGHVNLGTNEQLSPLALLNRLHYGHLEAISKLMRLALEYSAPYLQLLP